MDVAYNRSSVLVIMYDSRRMEKDPSYANKERILIRKYLAFLEFMLIVGWTCEEAVFYHKCKFLNEYTSNSRTKDLFHTKLLVEEFEAFTPALTSSHCPLTLHR